MKYEIFDKRPVLIDEYGGAVLLDDELWYPFEFKSNGDMDIYEKDGGYIKPSTAYRMAKKIFT